MSAAADTPSPDQAVVELKGLVKSFGPVRALDGVDLAVAQGELFGFLGPNGAGKTTTIRVMAGFIRPEAGTARIFGLDAWRDSVAVKRRIGFVPDVLGLYDGLTGQEFLEFMGRLHGWRRPPLQRELTERLRLSGGDLGRKLKGYSQGMRKKVALVQAMQHDPDLLVLDEPTEGLDPLMQQAFFSLLRELRDRGHTVFMSSHVLSEVEEVCERVAIIRGGRVVATGSLAGLRRGRVRTMRVEFRGPPPEALQAPGIRVVEREGSRWRLEVSGDINPLLRELATYELADMVFERPRLEELFLDYYREETPTP